MADHLRGTSGKPAEPQTKAAGLPNLLMGFKVGFTMFSWHDCNVRCRPGELCRQARSVIGAKKCLYCSGGMTAVSLRLWHLGFTRRCTGLSSTCQGYIMLVFLRLAVLRRLHICDICASGHRQPPALVSKIKSMRFCGKRYGSCVAASNWTMGHHRRLYR